MAGERADTRIRRLRRLSKCFLLLCAVGFCVQVFSVSFVYFQFQTSAQIRNILSERTVSPNVAVCARYTDILQYERLGQETGIRRNRTEDFDGVVRTQSLLTVRQVFEYTPPAAGVIASARIRHNDSFLLVKCKGSECDSEFSVSKFYLQEYMCYRICLRLRHCIDVDMTAFSLRSSHVLYYISLSDALANTTDSFRVIAHTDNWPHLSKDYAPVMNRFADFARRTVHTNTFSFSYMTNEVQLMRPPYDSDCEPDVRRSALLRHICMEEKLRPIHRLPFAGILTQPLPLPHLNYADLTNRTTADFVVRAEDQCAALFRRQACRFSFTITQLSQSKQRPGSRKFVVKMRIPSSPGIQVVMDAKTTLSEFLIFVGSCVGLWFGLSAADLSPVRLLTRSVRA